MENLLGTIYSWFESFFGNSLKLYLWGYDPSTGAFSNPNIFNILGLITLAISLILCIVFYYIFNHPRHSNIFTWLITLGINSVLALIIGFTYLHSKYINGYIPEDLIYQKDDSGNNLSTLIGDSNFWGFGLANFIIAAIFFIIISFIIKWRSSAAKHVPF